MLGDASRQRDRIWQPPHGTRKHVQSRPTATRTRRRYLGSGTVYKSSDCPVRDLKGDGKHQAVTNNARRSNSSLICGATNQTPAMVHGELRPRLWGQSRGQGVRHSGLPGAMNVYRPATTAGLDHVLKRMKVTKRVGELVACFRLT